MFVKSMILIVILLAAVNIYIANAVNCIKCEDCADIDSAKYTFCDGNICYVKLTNKVERGCSNNTICQNNSEPTCIECDSSYCNNKKYKNPTCTDNNNATRECNTFVDKCYYYIKGDLTDRGCLSEINDPDIEIECKNEQSKYCKTCLGNDCNKFSPLKCVKCDASDASCTTSIGDSLKQKAELCGFDDKSCYIKVDGTDHNSRGCQNEECSGEFESNSFCCKDSLCNVNKFPTSRHECHLADLKTTTVCLDVKDSCYSQFNNDAINRGCVGEDGNDCVANSNTCKVCMGNKCNKHAVCKKCTELDGASCESELCDTRKCYAGLQDSKMVRRCAEKDEICGSENYCDLCNTTDCNALKMPEGWRKCHQCNGPECSAERTDQAEYCPKYVRDDQCYTLHTGKETKRGCLTDTAEEICQNKETCKICSGDGCNYEEAKLNPPQSVQLHCVQCNKEDPKCGPKYDKDLEPTPCKTKLPEGKTDKCYSYKNETKRGCLSDLENDENCAKGITCYLCNSDGCNTQDVSASSTLTVSILLVTISTIITVGKIQY